MQFQLSFPLSVKLFKLARGTLLFVFIAMPFIDALTGYLINRGMLTIGSVGSPSQLFRFLLTVLLIVQIRKPIHLYKVLAVIVWISIVEFINLMLHEYLDWLIVGSVYSFKLSFGFIVYFVFKEYFDRKELDYQTLQNYMINSAAIYTLLIIISDILGISANSYVGAELGSKGIFADGNGMGVFLGVCLFVVLDRYIVQKKKMDLILFFLIGKVLIGLMSKAGILFLGFGFILLFCKQNMKVKIITITIMTLVLLICLQPIIDFAEKSLQMILWRLERTESWWEVIMGGRELYLQEAASYSYSNFIQIFKLFVGGGYRLSFRDPSSSLFDPDGIFIIEADIFDVFFMYGIIGFIVYILVLFKGLCAPKVQRIDILKWGWILLFIHSVLAGHVLSSGIALLILPCLLLLMENRKLIYQTKQKI